MVESFSKVSEKQLEAIDKMVARRLKHHLRFAARTSLVFSPTKISKRIAMDPFILKGLRMALKKISRQRKIKRRQRKTTARLNLWTWAKRRQPQLRMKPSIQRGCRRVRR